RRCPAARRSGSGWRGSWPGPGRGISWRWTSRPRDVSVDLPKGALTVVTGVSGSGKSSLVRDVLEAEATRRLLESLSLYERQSVHEGPEAPVRGLEGLGPTLLLGSERKVLGVRAS